MKENIFIRMFWYEFFHSQYVQYFDMFEKCCFVRSESCIYADIGRLPNLFIQPVNFCACHMIAYSQRITDTITSKSNKRFKRLLCWCRKWPYILYTTFCAMTDVDENAQKIYEIRNEYLYIIWKLFNSLFIQKLIFSQSSILLF